MRRGDGLHHDASRQLQVGDVQTALILYHRQLLLRRMDQRMEEAILPAANPRRAALNAISLDVLAAPGCVCLLQILEFLYAIGEFAHSLLQLDMAAKRFEQIDTFL